MKLRIILWSVLIGLILAVQPISSVQAVSTLQDRPPDEDEIIQIVLVLDVSDSMKWPIVTDDLSDEFVTLMQNIQEINQNPPWAALEADIAAILEDPEVDSARQTYQDTVLLLDDFFAANEFGESQAAIQQGIADDLAALTCDPTYARPISSALTLDEVDYWITESCATVGISFENQQALRDAVPYLGNPEYTVLQETSSNAYKIYFDALEARNYNGLIEQRDQIKADVALDAMVLEMDQMIIDQGIMRKLDLAKIAARSLLNLSELDSLAGRRASLIGLVRFSTDSLLVESITLDHNTLETKILALEPLELTNIYAGLESALMELENHADPDQPIVIILLSDGHITTGPAADTVLTEIPPRAIDMGAVICTVGFGETEGHVDWPLLTELAEKTGGEYLFAKSGEELMKFFTACRQGVVGEVVQFAGIVSPGETTPPDQILVPANVCELSMAVNYVFGSPDLQIVDPNAVGVDAAYPEFSVQESDNLKLYTILNPSIGNWQISVSSDAAATEDVIYSIVVTKNSCGPTTPTPTSEPTPTPAPTPIPPSFYLQQALPILPVIALVLFGLVFFLVFRRN